MKKSEEAKETLILDAPQDSPNVSSEPEQKRSLPPVSEPKKPEPLVVRANGAFSVSIGGSLRYYSVGELEADYSTAKYLLETGCPVSIAGGEEYSQCPNCKHMYKR